MKNSAPVVAIAVFAAVLMTAFPTAHGQFGREPHGHFVFENGRDAREIPFELNSDKIYLETTVNGEGPFWLVLDTGSPGMILDTKAVERLGLETGDPWQATGAGENTFPLAPVEGTVDVALPGVRLVGQNVVAGPIDQVVGPFEGRRIDGVLGCYNIFADFVVEIDYAGGSISVIRPDAFDPGNGAKILPVTIENGHAHFEASITLETGDPVTARFMLDTGLRGTGILTSAFVSEHGLVDRCGPTVVATTGGGIGGEVRSRLGRIVRFDAGDVTLENLYIGMYLGSTGAMATDEIGGIFGSAILQRYRAVFDYPGERVVLYDAEFDADRLDMDKSGMFLVLDADDRTKTLVIDVVAGSPAHDAGLAKGDVVLQVDGVAANELGLEMIRRMLRQKVGTSMTLVAERGGRRFDIRLTLRRIV